MKIKTLALILLIGLNIGWDTNQGTSVVSDSGAIVRTSIEATAVLQSDVLANLLTETRLGGTTNYASFDSGGVLSFITVISSSDTILMSNNDKLRWLNSDGTQVRIGVSTNDVFVIPASIDVQNVSAERVLVTSIDSTEYSVSGTPGITSIYSVNSGSCTITFNAGVMNGTTC